jgi:Putative prokaryotic signal transducing protein
MAIQSRGDIIRLATVHNADFCRFLQQLLEAEGIRCQVVGEYLYPGGFIGETSWPELWIRRKDLARAVKVLRVAMRDRRSEYAQEDEHINEYAFKVLQILAWKMPWIVVGSFVIVIAIIIAVTLSTHF